MTIYDLALLVKKMRDAQITDDFEEAKYLEKIVDQTIQDILQDNNSHANCSKRLEEILDTTIQKVASRLSTSNNLSFQLDVMDLPK